MTLNEAVAYIVPLGPERNRPLACVALDRPEYLSRLAEDGAVECKKGTQFHQAVCLVVERLRANAEADILAGRTIGAGAFRSSAEEIGALNAIVLANRGEANKGGKPGPPKRKPRRDTSRRPAGLLGGFDEKEGG